MISNRTLNHLYKERQALLRDREQLEDRLKRNRRLAYHLQSHLNETNLKLLDIEQDIKHTRSD